MTEQTLDIRLLERRILSACLARDKAIINTVITHITLADFTEPSHRQIFNLILDIFIDGEIPTMYKIGERARATKQDCVLSDLHRISAPDVNLINHANVKADCEELRDNAARYNLVKIGNLISKTAAHRNGKTTKELTNSLYSQMLEMLTSEQSGGLMSLGEAIGRTEDMQREYQAKNQYTRLKTGFEKLDDIYIMQPGKVTVLAAYTSCGKSALALCIANNMIQAGIPVLYVSIEMSHADIVYRLASMNGDTNLMALVRGNIQGLGNHPGLAKLSRYFDNLHIADLDMVSEVEIVLLMQQHMLRYPDTGLVIIDYLQNIDCEREPRASRHLQMSSIMRYLRASAKKLKVNTIIVSQLARPEIRDGKFRMLTPYDLKESGDIENTTDAIILINRLPGNKEPGKWHALVNVRKQRQGMEGIVEMQFDGPHVRFKESLIPSDIMDEITKPPRGKKQ
jgi:replicative DNA helicase